MKRLQKGTKGIEIISDALSPTRLKKILISAKKAFPGEFSLSNIPNIVNEKCRKMRLYKKQK